MSSLPLAAAAGRAPAKSLTISSVEEAIAHAEKHNPELREYGLRGEQANRRYEALRFHWLPDIYASGSLKINPELPVTPVPGELFGQPGRTVDAQFGQTYNYQAGLRLSTTLLDLRTHFAARAAGSASRGAAANAGAFGQRLREEVAVNYYTALATRALLRGQRSSEREAATLVEIVEARLVQGVVDQIALNCARMNENAVRQDVANYLDILEQTLTNLRILLGVPAGTTLTLTEELQTREAALVGDALGPDLTLEVEEAYAVQTRFQWREQRARWLPKLTLDAYLGGQHLRDDFGLSFGDGAWSGIQYLTLSLDIPLFTGLDRWNEVKAAEAERAYAEVALARRRDESRAIDESLVKRRRIYWKQVTLTRVSHQLSRTNTKLTLQKYAQGVSGLEQYLSAREEQRGAEAAFLNALLSYYRLVSTYLSREGPHEFDS
ncbi:MAG: TolC family protein [Myxococcota bacterium]